MKKEKSQFGARYSKNDERMNKISAIQMTATGLVSILSFVVIILMWQTDTFNKMILNNFLRNDTEILQYFIKPPSDSVLKVYIYNYSNIEEYSSRIDRKIKIQEIGPYVYKEVKEKINIQYNGDEMTFQQQKTYEFDAEKSATLTEQDEIIAPNIPLLTTLASIPKLSFVFRVVANTILKTSKPKEFQKIKVKDYLFGYTDDLLSAIGKLNWKFTPEDAGILTPRKKTVDNVITANIGTKDVNNYGNFLKFRGKSTIDMWKSDLCRSDLGYDEMFGGPANVWNKKNLSMFCQDACRQVPMVFDREVLIFDYIPTYHYVIPKNVLNKPNDQIDNEFYCESKNAGPEHINGVVDVSDCLTGSPPVYFSYPHFMEGDEKLFENFEGLHPNRTLHESHAYFHPRFSIFLKGFQRLQVNIQLKHYKNYYQNFANEIILPVLWVESSLEDLSEYVKFKIYLTTVVVDYVEVILKYGSILVFIAFFNLFIISLIMNLRNRKEKDCVKRSQIRKLLSTN